MAARLPKIAAAMTGVALFATQSHADPRLAGTWRVEQIAGVRVPPGIDVSIAFRADGAVTGRSGCNRFMGRHTVSGDTLRFGPLAGTRMACPPPRMEVERRFLETMERVERFDLNPRGRLRLAGSAGELIRARRVR